jgi:glycosyltransferase involved in cell wall biosynthesis
LEPHTLAVGVTAALTEEKDLLTFIRTAEILCRRDSRFHFFIIGRGPLRKKLEHFAHERKVTSRITFTGFIPDVHKYLPSLDIYLMTSRSEGLGTSVLDAMAARVPVVASRTGGIPEMITHRRTGCLASVRDYRRMADEILFLADHPLERAEIVSRARRRVETQFSKTTMALKTYELYIRILQPQRTG